MSETNKISNNQPTVIDQREINNQIKPADQQFFCRWRVFLFSLFVILSLGINAQTYPVQVNVHAMAPYSNHLTDYYTTTREKLVVSLLNRDHLRPNLEVQLQMTITAANGLKIQSRSEAVYPTITLDEGILTRLTQDDLEPYFRHITTQGYFDNGKLPDGQVEFTFQAIEKYTKKTLSLPGTARVWLSAQKPPLLSLPLNNEFIAFSDPLNISFQWTPQHRNISQIEYEFELREIPNTGVAPQSAFSYAPVIYQERILYTRVMYNMMMPPLDPNKTYGWRVRAIGKDGVDELNLFENNGYSEIFFFTTQTNCLAPVNCLGNLDGRRLDLSWQPATGNTEYQVQYRSQTSTSPEWITAATANTKLSLYDMKRGETYEFRVGGLCGYNSQPVFSTVGQIIVPEVDSARLARCGIMPVINLDNREPLPALKSGEVVMLSDFPMTVTRVSGSDGTFSGEGWVPINWLFDSKLKVEFDQIAVNTDYQLIDGSVRAMYDDTESQIADLDEIFEGGNENTRNGIVIANITFDFVIPENPVFTYNDNTGEMLVYDTNGNPQTVELPKDNDSKVIFPVVVKDKEGNMYKLEADEDSTTSSYNDDGTSLQPDNTSTLKSTYLGKQNEPLATNAFDRQNLTPNTAVVTFTGGGKYAFDEWLDYYETANKIGGRDMYDHLASPDGAYHVPWKYLVAGESDVVEAKIKIDNKKEIEPEKVIFTTPQGTAFSAEYNTSKSTYHINLTSGSDGDVQEIYALYRVSGENYHTLGKLNVITYNAQVPKLTVVHVNGYTIDPASLKQHLDEVYHPVGVDWQVSVDTFYYSGLSGKFFEDPSKLLSAYNDNMNNLQSAYKQVRNVQRDACYLFILNYSGGNDRNTAGFMPRGKQFGYIFKGDLISKEINNTVAHELGHGLWKLRHTFDNSYGSTAVSTEGKTNNLMDYSNGTHLAKWQWDQLAAPAIFDGVFDKDEDAMQKGIPSDNALKLVHMVRFAHAYGNVRVTLGEKKATNSPYSLTTYDVNLNVGKVMCVIKGGNDFTLSPSNTTPERLLEDSYKGCIRFGVGKGISTSSRYHKELEFIVPTELGETWLKENSFLLPDKKIWNNWFLGVINGDVGNLTKTLNLLPDEAFNVIDYEQIYTIINKILSQSSYNEKDIVVISKSILLSSTEAKKQLINSGNFKSIIESNYNKIFKASNKDLFFRSLAIYYDDCLMNGLQKEPIGGLRLGKEQKLAFAVLHTKETKSEFIGNNQLKFRDNSSIVFGDSNPATLNESDILTCDMFDLINFEFLKVDNSGIFVSENNKSLSVPAIYVKYLLDTQAENWSAHEVEKHIDMLLFATGLTEVGMGIKGLRYAPTVFNATRTFIGISDLLSTIASSYCRGNEDKNGKFCQAYEKYELVLQLTLISSSILNARLEGLRDYYSEIAYLDKNGELARLLKVVNQLETIDFTRMGVSEVMRHTKFRDLSVSRKAGIGGCHDAIEFAKIRQTTDPSRILTGKSLDDIPEIVIINRNAHLTTPGVEIIEYKIPTLDSKTNLTTGNLSTSSLPPKTIYNPQIWTDNKLIKALKEAYSHAVKAGQAKDKASIGIFGDKFLGKTSDGYLIEGFVRDGKFQTFYFK